MHLVFQFRHNYISNLLDIFFSVWLHVLSQWILSTLLNLDTSHNMKTLCYYISFLSIPIF